MDNTKIIDLEKKIFQLRLELDDLSKASGGLGSAQMQDKLKFLSVEITHLNNQLNFLKQESMQPARPVVSAPVQTVTPAPVKPVAPTPVPQAETPVAKPVAPTPLQQIDSTSMKHTPTSAKQAAPASDKKFDLEGKIGKSWMGIFASVLVFISVVMFAAVIIPNLTDAMKMAIMFIFAFGLTAFALYLLLGKDSENKLYLALTGCGVGCVYISLIVSSLYFKIIGPYVLFALLFIWSAGVCMLLRYKNLLFTIIGEIGVTIAVIIGCVYSSDSDSIVSLGAVLAFLVLTQLMFFIANRTRSYLKNMPSHITIFIGMIAIITANYAIDLLATPMLMASFICILVYMVCLVFVFEDKTGVLAGCTLIPYFIMLFATESPTIVLPYVMLTQIIAVAFVIIAVIKQKNDTMEIANVMIIKITAAITILAAAVALEQPFAYVIFTAVFYLILGIVFSDSFSVYLGMVVAFIHGSALVDYDVAIAAVSAIVILALEIIALIKKYNVVKKICVVIGFYWYIIAFTILVTDMFSVDAIYPGFVLIAVANMIFTKALNKNLITGEDEQIFNIFANAINGCLLVVSLPLMYAADEWHVIIVLVTFALLCLNALWQLRHTSVLMNIYVTVKYTLYIIAVLGSFDVESIWISAAILLFAVACIVIGYIMDKKGVRIYGLIIANLSVAKLILIDISYRNTLEHALSFLGCGVLCFVISFIYTIIEKRENKKEII